MKNTSKVAIITGASRGIGRAIALRLARDGFGVVVNHANNKVEADKVVGEIEAARGRAIAIQADISKTEDVARLFDQAERAFDGVDVLVNSAGIMKVEPIADFDDATFDRIFAINVRGTFNTLKQAVKRLRRGGRIINLSSSVIGLALPGYAPYGASKAAVETLSNIFAKELRGKDLTVNAIAPGPTATELFFQDKSEEEIKRQAKLPPLERLGRPEDIAAVVSFLVGPEGGWINGQTIRANGGMV
jgi:3-oxoacyl-[acyl-carrier protein] reductase